MTTDEPYISINAAAKAIGMNRLRMRELCISAGVAVRWGGTNDHPFLKVKLSEARRAVDQNKQYVARGPAKRVARRGAAVTNPDVRC